MSNEQAQQARRLFCLYAVYGDITECKLALLRGARAYSNCHKQVIPFVLNALSADGPGHEARCKNFFDYLLLLQKNYHKALNDSGLAGASLPYELDGKTPITVSHVVEAHRILCNTDGTDPGDAMIGKWWERTAAPWSLPDEAAGYLQQGLLESRATYVQFERFQLECEKKTIKLFHNLNQTTAEFMEYFTHLTRAYKFHLDDLPPGKIEDEIVAGVRHLKRVTLDMRKSIIATSYKNWPAKIGKDLTKSMLRSRAEEVVMGVADGKKFTLYKDEVEAVLNLRLFE